MDYRVSLDIFDGPLDLLLHLIRKHELDVCDVALAQITDSYVKHVAMLRDLAARGEGGGIDLETVGEFLVVAATLIETKSARLLPRPEAAERRARESDAEEALDPRLELVRQLLEYKKIKDAAGQLDDRRERFSQRFARVPAHRLEDPDEPAPPPPLALEELHAWDLLEIFEKLLDEVGRRGPGRHEVVDDDTPLDLHAADLSDRVRRDGHVSLRQLLRSRANRGEMVGIFLALLELVRQKQVLIALTDDGDLDITDAPDDHKRLGEELTETKPDTTPEETHVEHAAHEP